VYTCCICQLVLLKKIDDDDDDDEQQSCKAFIGLTIRAKMTGGVKPST